VLLDGGLEGGGEQWTQGKWPAGAAGAALPRWEEGDGADTRAPSVRGWEREGR
jgi:hypothetical protein